jgi:zinc transport system substrate-binding protein
MARLFRLRTWSRGVVLAGSLLALVGCAPSPLAEADFVTTIPPLQLILQELTGDVATVACILPPGASPHTYELRPSTARLLESAKAVFYVDDSIDGWAARLAPGRIHSFFSMVPEAMRRESHGEHNHGDEAAGSATHPKNAHFWSDPVVVKAIIPGLVAILTELDPENGAAYEARASTFMGTLDALDQEFRSAPALREGYGFVAFHPSWCYFFERYGIEVGAYVEPFPGKEPTPQTIQQLEKELSGAGRRVVLSELQLPAKSAEVLAETLDAKIAVIDPLGGQGERRSYAGLLRYNATQVYEALR